MEQSSLMFAIPIIAIIMGCAIPIVIISVITISDYRKKRAIYELHHRERLAAIEKGMEVPPLPTELFNGGSKARGPGSYLLRGLIWSAIGIGILISFRQFAEDVSLLGVIPLGIGIAYLIYYAVEGRRLRLEEQKSETKASAPV